MNASIRKVEQLNPREKDILRLLAQGHDAKSAARLLDLTTYAVNERLREARRKLEVSSSREAARLLLEAEREQSQKICDNRIEVDAVNDRSEVRSEPSRKRRTALWTGVGIMLLIAISTLAVWNLQPPLAKEHRGDPVTDGTNSLANATERAANTYSVQLEIRAADKLIARPTLLTRAGEITSVSQTGLYEIHFLVASDPNHPTNTRVSANILLSQDGSQLRYSRVISVPYGHSASFELEQIGALRPSITSVAVTALRAQAE